MCLSYIFSISKKLSKSYLFLLSFLSTTYIWGTGTDAISDCGKQTFQASCIPQINHNTANITAGTASACQSTLFDAISNCEHGRSALWGTAGDYNGAGSGPAVDSGVGGAAGMAKATAAAGFFKGCLSSLKTAQKPCAQLPPCATLVQNLTYTCTENLAGANTAAAQGGLITKAADALKNNWKPLLIGAALGAGAMALLGKKKGGGGGDNNPEVKKDEDDKLKALVMNSSSSSSAVPNIIYYDKGTPNNNGSLGNPAVIASSTTSNPSDAVTVAGITPSSSFGGTQNPSSLGDSDPAPLSRTLSGSAGSTSLGGDSGGSMNGSSPEGADYGNSASGSLVDGSSNGSGGGTGFMGGMDGSGGSAQGNSADGTMLTGVLSGASSAPKKTRALSNLKNQKSLSAAKLQPIPSSSTKLRGVSNKRTLASEKQTKPQSLVEYMRANNLIRSPKSPQK